MFLLPISRRMTFIKYVFISSVLYFSLRANSIFMYTSSQLLTVLDLFDLNILDNRNIIPTQKVGILHCWQYIGYLIFKYITFVIMQ